MTTTFLSVVGRDVPGGIGKTIFARSSGLTTWNCVASIDTFSGATGLGGASAAYCFGSITPGSPLPPGPTAMLGAPICGTVALTAAGNSGALVASSVYLFVKS